MRTDKKPKAESKTVGVTAWNTAPREIGHRGHGPKNYARSDERIYEDVCELLTRDDAVDAREIEVFVANGSVTLRGTVATRQMKDAALHAIETATGVKATLDDLRVGHEERIHA